MSDDLSALLIEGVRERFPTAIVDVMRFEAGAFMLDVRLGHRFFVVAYSPTRGFGVDEVHEEDAMDSSYRYAAAGVDEVISRLVELIGGTPRLEA